MTQLSREQLIEELERRIAVITQYPGVEEAKLDAQIFKFALAAMAAEAQKPVADIYAELYRLREDIKGPDGFDTWKDAALAEKKARIKCEQHINKSGQDIDYLTAMAAFHSDDWHKMGPITAYMHGWNARKAIVPDPNITRDALRYRFLRDKDAFGADNEPGLVNWDELVDLELNDFDAAIDARMSHPNVAWAAQFSTPQPVAVPDVLICDMCGHDARHQGGRTYQCVEGHRFEVRAPKTEPVSQPYTLPDGRSLTELFDKISLILSGIDLREADSEEGWREASTGAEFGKEKLEQIRSVIFSSSPKEPTK